MESLKEERSIIYRNQMGFKGELNTAIIYVANVQPQHEYGV
jgi:phosphoenolpyruvate synthase/pyruvate phosphate dikinase